VNRSLKHPTNIFLEKEQELKYSTSPIAISSGSQVALIQKVHKHK